MADKLAAAFHGASLTDTLRPILAAYRAEVQPHWSAATAHPDYEGAAGSPVGQCGVTSAWLQRRLAEDHGIETRYWIGTLHTPTHDLCDAKHCWLELPAEDGDNIIIDLTADQYSGMPAVVFDAYAELVLRDWTYYTAQTHVTPVALLADPVQPRLAILTEAVGR